MPADTLSATFSALADPTRRAILARLAQGEASISELAEPFELSVRAISKHVSVLEQAGLITKSRDAQRRPSRIALGPLQQVDTWLAGYRRLWEGRFDKMEKILARVQAEKKKP